MEKERNDPLLRFYEENVCPNKEAKRSKQKQRKELTIRPLNTPASTRNTLAKGKNETKTKTSQKQQTGKTCHQESKPSEGGETGSVKKKGNRIKIECSPSAGPSPWEDSLLDKLDSDSELKIELQKIGVLNSLQFNHQNKHLITTKHQNAKIINLKQRSSSEGSKKETQPQFDLKNQVTSNTKSKIPQFNKIGAKKGKVLQNRPINGKGKGAVSSSKLPPLIPQIKFDKRNSPVSQKKGRNSDLPKFTSLKKSFELQESLDFGNGDKAELDDEEDIYPLIIEYNKKPQHPFQHIESLKDIVNTSMRGFQDYNQYLEENAESSPFPNAPIKPKKSKKKLLPNLNPDLSEKPHIKNEALSAAARVLEMGRSPTLSTKTSNDSENALQIPSSKNTPKGPKLKKAGTECTKPSKPSSHLKAPLNKSAHSEQLEISEETTNNSDIRQLKSLPPLLTKPPIPKSYKSYKHNTANKNKKNNKHQQVHSAQNARTRLSSDNHINNKPHTFPNPIINQNQIPNDNQHTNSKFRNCYVSPIQIISKMEKECEKRDVVLAGEYLHKIDFRGYKHEKKEISEETKILQRKDQRIKDYWRNRIKPDFSPSMDENKHLEFELRMHKFKSESLVPQIKRVQLADLLKQNQK